jgi:predicted DCC family thiol-disulfide oxidoreductase YuxK
VSGRRDGGAAEPLLLYDGTCALCSRTVAFALRYDRSARLRFAPLDGETARRFVERHAELEHADTVVWVPDGSDPAGPVLIRSDAALALAEYLGGPWRLLGAARIVPRAWRDSLYDFVARHRHAIFDDGPRCVVPPAGARQRFLG